MPCPSEFETSLGRVVVVDKKVTYSTAVDYCESEHSARLLPVTSESFLDEILEKIPICHRSNVGWNVGLVADNGEGEWSNGESYDGDKQESLFYKISEGDWKKPNKSKTYQVASLNLNLKKLMMEDCCFKRKFFCWKPSHVGAPPEQATAVPTVAATTAAPEVATQQQWLTKLLFAGIPLVCLIFFVIVVCAVLRRRRGGGGSGGGGAQRMSAGCAEEVSNAVYHLDDETVAFRGEQEVSNAVYNLDREQVVSNAVYNLDREQVVSNAVYNLDEKVVFGGVSEQMVPNVVYNLDREDGQVDNPLYCARNDGEDAVYAEIE